MYLASFAFFGHVIIVICNVSDSRFPLVYREVTHEFWTQYREIWLSSSLGNFAPYFHRRVYCASLCTSINNNATLSHSTSVLYLNNHNHTSRNHQRSYLTCVLNFDTTCIGQIVITTLKRETTSSDSTDGDLSPNEFGEHVLPWCTSLSLSIHLYHTPLYAKYVKVVKRSHNIPTTSFFLIYRYTDDVL